MKISSNTESGKQKKIDRKCKSCKDEENEENRMKIEILVHIRVPTTGFFGGRLDPNKFKRWVYDNRIKLWRLFYGAIPY